MKATLRYLLLALMLALWASPTASSNKKNLEKLAGALEILANRVGEFEESANIFEDTEKIDESSPIKTPFNPFAGTDETEETSETPIIPRPDNLTDPNKSSGTLSEKDKLRLIDFDNLFTDDNMPPNIESEQQQLNEIEEKIIKDNYVNDKDLDLFIKALIRGTRTLPPHLPYSKKFVKSLAENIDEKTSAAKLKPLIPTLSAGLFDSQNSDAVNKILQQKNLRAEFTPERIMEGLFASASPTEKEIEEGFQVLKNNNLLRDEFPHKLAEEFKKSEITYSDLAKAIKLTNGLIKQGIDLTKKDKQGKTVVDKLNTIDTSKFDEYQKREFDDLIASVSPLPAEKAYEALNKYYYTGPYSKEKLFDTVAKDLGEKISTGKLKEEEIKFIQNLKSTEEDRLFDEVKKQLPGKLTPAQFLSFQIFTKECNKTTGSLQLLDETPLGDVLDLLNNMDAKQHNEFINKNLSILSNANKMGDTIFHYIAKNFTKLKQPFELLSTLWQNLEKRAELLNNSARQLFQELKNDPNIDSATKEQLSNFLDISTIKETKPKTVLIITKPGPGAEGKKATTVTISKEILKEWKNNLIDYQDRIRTALFNNPGSKIKEFFIATLKNPDFKFIIAADKTAWQIKPAHREYLEKELSGLAKNRTILDLDVLYHIAAHINPALITSEFIEKNWQQQWKNATYDKQVDYFDGAAFFQNKKNAQEALKRGWLLVLDTAYCAYGMVTYYLDEAIKGTGHFAKNAPKIDKATVCDDFNNAIRFFTNADVWVTRYENKGDEVDTIFVKLLKGWRNKLVDLLGATKEQTKEALKVTNINVDDFINLVSRWVEDEKNRRWCEADFLATKVKQVPVAGLEPKKDFQSEVFTFDKLTCEPNTTIVNEKHTSYFQSVPNDIAAVACDINRYKTLVEMLSDLKKNNDMNLIENIQKEKAFETRTSLTLRSILKTINTFVSYLLDAIDDSNRENFKGWLETRGLNVVNDEILTKNFKKSGISFKSVTARVCPVCFSAYLRDEDDRTILLEIANFLSEVSKTNKTQEVAKAIAGVALLKIFWILTLERDIWFIIPSENETKYINDETKDEWELPDNITTIDPITKKSVQNPIDIKEIAEALRKLTQNEEYAPHYTEEELSTTARDLRLQPAHFMRQKELFPLGKAWREM